MNVQSNDDDVARCLSGIRDSCDTLSLRQRIGGLRRRKTSDAKLRASATKLRQLSSNTGGLSDGNLSVLVDTIAKYGSRVLGMARTNTKHKM
jgi:hypothetical protein